MFKKQEGFTLIELMIVVAIIAILAAIAIPLYLSYVGRAQASEAMSLASSAETSVSEYYSSNGTYAANNTDAGLAPYDQINGKYVASVGVGGPAGAGGGNAGEIYVTFRPGAPVSQGLRGGLMYFSPSTTAGTIIWTCKADTTIFRYVPSQCRNAGP